MQYKNKNIKKYVLVFLAAALLLVGGWFGYKTYKDRSDNNNWKDGVNYSPPTDEEKAVGDTQKEEVDRKEESQNKPDDSPDKKSVTVIITDAGQYDGIIEVRSFVPDFFQDGTCTTTFTKGSRTFKKEMPARTDSSTTICMNPLLKRSEFPVPGVWQVKVTYSSKDAQGVSETQNLTIE